MINIVLIGPPGSGKGTQAAQVASRIGVAHISTGDIFRDHARRRSALGVEAERHMSAGQLVPDEITIQMLAERLTHPDTEPGFILDGFPRTTSQAVALDEMLARRGRVLDVVLVLDLPVEEAMARIANRARDEDRHDDGRSVAARRQSVYAVQTAPLIARYAAAGLVSRIDALGSVADVSARIDEALLSTARPLDTSRPETPVSTTH